MAKVRTFKDLEQKISKIASRNNHRGHLVNLIEGAAIDVMNSRSNPQEWLPGSLALMIAKLIRFGHTYSIDVWRCAAECHITDAEIIAVISQLHVEPRSTVVYQRIIYWIERKAISFGIAPEKLFGETLLREINESNGFDWWASI